MTFNYIQITEEKRRIYSLPRNRENALEEVRAYSQSQHEDKRGRIWTHSSYTTSERDFTSGTKFTFITKFNQNKLGVVRGLHGDNFSEKTISVISGSVIAYAFNPINKNWSWYYLDDITHNVINLPAGYGNGFVSLKDNTIYCYTLKVAGDNYIDKDDQFTIKFGTTQISLPTISSNYIFSKRDFC